MVAQFSFMVVAAFYAGMINIIVKSSIYFSDNKDFHAKNQVNINLQLFYHCGDTSRKTSLVQRIRITCSDGFQYISEKYARAKCNEKVI